MMSTANVFLSHAHRDRTLATHLHHLLTDASERRLHVWRSSASETTGLDHFRVTVNRRLRAARIILILLTRFSNSRPWLLYESGFIEGAGRGKTKTLTLLFGISHED